MKGFDGGSDGRRKAEESAGSDGTRMAKESTGKNDLEEVVVVEGGRRGGGKLAAGDEMAVAPLDGRMVQNMVLAVVTDGPERTRGDVQVQQLVGECLWIVKYFEINSNMFCLIKKKIKFLVQQEMAMQVSNYSRELKAFSFEGGSGAAEMGSPLQNHNQDSWGLHLDDVEVAVVERKFSPRVDRVFGSLFLDLGMLHVSSYRDFLIPSDKGRDGEYCEVVSNWFYMIKMCGNANTFSFPFFKKCFDHS